MNGTNEPILQVRNLKASFFTHAGEVQAVRGVSFELYRGEILGIVGESGSGKSQTCMSVMRLLQPPGKITHGEILFHGSDLAQLDEKAMQAVRGDKISMVFQDPMTALNPVYTIGNQMVEVIRAHRKVSKSEAQEVAAQMLGKVGIPSPEARLRNYPHEFSGGMRQRAMIAMALSCNPEVLIADEPTTALDVTIQAQVLDLIKDLQKTLNMGVVLVTHDLGVIAQTCQRVIVMYGGMIMEQAAVEDIFYSPRNPYTLGLLKSVPNPKRMGKEPLVPIEGSPPDLLSPPKGCPFAPRCQHTMNVCLSEVPPLYKVGEGHLSRCWLLDKMAPSVDIMGKAVED